MSAISKIEWTDRTWNPVRGCAIVSPGCVNCYAMKQAHRFSGPGGAYEGLTKLTKAGPQWTGKVRTIESAVLAPLSWRGPARVFVNSMSDLFHDAVPDSFIDLVFNVMAYSPHLTFQVLTKRPHRMQRYLSDSGRDEAVYDAIYNSQIAERSDRKADAAICRGMDRISSGMKMTCAWPLPNVWVGVSAEDQQRADERIPYLLQTPSAVRFISAEPLLGPVDLEQVPLPDSYLRMVGVQGVAQPLTEKDTEPDDYRYWQRKYFKLDWVIVGGESGPRARPCNIEWIESIVKQCDTAKVPVFVKQLGAAALDWSKVEPTGNFRTNPDTGKRQFEVKGPRWLKHTKGGDPSEWPEALRVRQFPELRS